MSDDNKDYLKLLKQLPTGVAEEMEAMSEEELKKQIVESSNNIRVAKQEMADNDGVKAAKVAYQDAAAPFRDAMKAQRARIDFALYMLETKGKI